MQRSIKPNPRIKHQTVHPDPSRHGVPKPIVAYTPPSKEPTTTSSAPESISPAQLRAKFTPLIHTIEVLGGSRSRANYESIKHAMRNRYKEMRSFGWSSFGEMVSAAYKAQIVETIRKKPNGKITSLRLLPPPPPPPVPSTVAADYYPSEHLPVVQTMLSFMGGDMDAAVSMVTLATALGQCYPRKEGEYSLIAKAEAAGVLRQGEGAYGGTWAYLNRPLVPAVSQPLPGGSNAPAKASALHLDPPPGQSTVPERKGAKKARRVPLKAATQPVSVSVPYPQPALQSTPAIPMLLTEQTASESTSSSEHVMLSFPLKHRPVITVLMQGTPGRKTRVEVLRLLKVEYPGAREEFLRELVEKAEGEGVVVGERDRYGVEWMSLRGPG